ncbi:Hypothetical protein GbCGDNIH3_7185 [Granulibacter bethesdensis]|uniref:Uncharacterized protein n=1 Tax=Granulibacter bethesdensis TaxID=364410 RepID=A0AAN0RC66_9PROT|nr:hypothetical protein [Granulibacter bethesdensis]AHJ62103.1 Hypothetical protein GbCGDNIH3_7185 [Granulibacter bethesdensis]
MKENNKYKFPMNTNIHIILFMLIGSFVSIFILLETLNWIYHHHIIVPWNDDMFDHVRMHHAMGNFKSFFAYLISPHNEHRILTTRIFSYLDEQFALGREYTHTIATVLFQALSASIACILFKKCIPFEFRYINFIIFPFIFLFFISPNFLYTLIVPFQLQFAIMQFLCVCTAFVISSASTENASDIKTQQKTFLFLIFLAFIASFTLGNSPTILISSAITAFILRWNRYTVIALFALAIVHTAIMLDITPPTGTRSHNVIEIIKFSLIYIGGPFTRVDPWPANFVTWHDSPYFAAICGCIIFVSAICFAVARIIRPHLGGRLAIFGFVILSIVIITSLAAGLARSQFGILEALNKKYASFAVMSWLGFYVMISGILLHKKNIRYFLIFTLISSLMIITLTLSSLGREERIWSKANDMLWESALAGFSKINYHDEVRNMDNIDQDIIDYFQYAEVHNLGVFSYFPFRIGDNAQAFLTARKETGCRGEVEKITPVPAQSFKYFDVSGSPASIEGWAWMNDENKPATTVIAVDTENHIVGVARSTRKSSRAEEWLSQSFDQNLGWFGFARPNSWKGITFYALTRSGKYYCPLGTLGNAR